MPGREDRPGPQRRRVAKVHHRRCQTFTTTCGAAERIEAKMRAHGLQSRVSMKLIVAAVMIGISVGDVARAQNEPPPDNRQPSSSRPWQGPWYGWQTGLADAAAVGLFIAGNTGGPPQLSNLGGASFVLTSPIIHFSHERPGAGFASLVLRALGPLGGAGVGLILSGCLKDDADPPPPPDQRSCDRSLPLVGLGLGILVPIVYDLTTAREDPGGPNWPQRGNPTTAWMPTIAPSQSGASVGVVGVF